MVIHYEHYQRNSKVVNVMVSKEGSVYINKIISKRALLIESGCVRKITLFLYHVPVSPVKFEAES